MSNRILCGLRTQRRLWGLNQEEPAGLLGVRGPAQICRLEQGERVPPFPVVIAIELLFNVSAGSIFVGIKDEVEENFMARVYSLQQRLIDISTDKAERKRELLEQVLRRGTNALRRN